MSEFFDEMNETEGQLDSARLTLEQIELAERAVLTEGKVDRLTMESLFSVCPEAQSEIYPLASFTKEPSEQNLEASLEMLSIAKTIAAVAVGALLGKMLMSLIGIFRSDKAEDRSKWLKEKIDNIRKDQKDFVKRMKDMDRSPIPPDVRKDLDSIFDWAAHEESKLSSKSVSTFVDEVSPGGDIFGILTKWSRSIHKQYTSFNARVNKLTEIIDRMYDASGDTVKKLAQDAESIALSEKDPFIDDIAKLKDLIDRRLNEFGGDFSSFLKTEVLPSEAFKELALGQDDSWMRQVDRLTPNGMDQLNKNLDGLEKNAQSLIDGKRTSAKAAKRQSRQKAGVDNVFEIKTATINANLEMAVKKAELGIRKEAQYFALYRHSLSRVLAFYQHAVKDRENFLKKQNSKLTVIEGKIPPKEK